MDSSDEQSSDSGDDQSMGSAEDPLIGIDGEQPSHIEPSLHNAIQTNNFTAIKNLISSGYNIRHIDSRGRTCLHLAISCRLSHRAFFYLLNVASNLKNEKTYEGETALLVACENNLYEYAEILLKAGCDPNISNNENITPLHYVCTLGYTSLVLLLISYGALLDLQDFNGFTPLHEAAAYGHEAIVICSALLKGGADVTIKERNGRTAFEIACSSGNLEFVKLFAEYPVDVNVRNAFRATPLMAAVQSKSLEVTQFLLSKGAGPNEVDSDNVLPLHLAVRTFYPKLLSIILKATDPMIILKYCSWDEQPFQRLDDLKFRSLLCLALEEGDFSSLKFLLKSSLPDHVKTCVDVDHESGIFVPPLSYCVNKLCKLELNVEFLYAFGKEYVQHLEERYWIKKQYSLPVLSPICAALNGTRLQDVRHIQSIISWLLDVNADVDYTDQSYEMVAGIHFEAIPELNSNIVKTLPDAFKFAIAFGNFHIVFMLLQCSRIIEPYHIFDYICEYSKLPAFGNVNYERFIPDLLQLSPCFHATHHPKFFHKYKSVPSLAMIARDIIRKILHKNRGPKLFFSSIGFLQLPETLREFLIY